MGAERCEELPVLLGRKAGRGHAIIERSNRDQTRAAGLRRACCVDVLDGQLRAYSRRAAWNRRMEPALRAGVLFISVRDGRVGEEVLGGCEFVAGADESEQVAGGENGRW